MMDTFCYKTPNSFMSNDTWIMDKIVCIELHPLMHAPIEACFQRSALCEEIAYSYKVGLKMDTFCCKAPTTLIFVMFTTVTYLSLTTMRILYMHYHLRHKATSLNHLNPGLWQLSRLGCVSYLPRSCCLMVIYLAFLLTLWQSKFCWVCMLRHSPAETTDDTRIT